MSTKRAKGKSADILDREVQNKVDYSLDMVAHDLIASGQLPASKSYVLKSPEIKAQMGRQVMSLNRRRYSIANTSAKNVTFKPLSIPIGIVTKFSTANATKSKKTVGSRNSVAPSEVETKRVFLPSRTKTLESKGPVKISHSKTIQLSTNHHQKEKKKTAKALQSITASSNTMIQESFKTRVDLKEFNNEEIFIDIQDRTIKITGYRPRKGSVNSRKVTEIVQVPEHVLMDRLRIGRRPDGGLIVEECFQH